MIAISCIYQLLIRSNSEEVVERIFSIFWYRFIFLIPFHDPPIWVLKCGGSFSFSFSIPYDLLISQPTAL